MFGEKHHAPVTDFLLVLVLIALVGVNVQLGMLTAGLSGNTVVTGIPQPAAPSPSQPSAATVPTDDDDPSLGSASAAVTVIEFSDFQCPFCKRWHTDSWAQLKAEYVDTGKVRFVYRDFPLSFHLQAQKAAEAAECADEQGKFWPYHDVLFEKGQGDGTGLQAADLKQYAADLGLNAATFNSCLDSGKYAAEVNKDQSDGSAGGVGGTPTFFVNGEAIVGAVPYGTIKAAIDSALA